MNTGPVGPCGPVGPTAPVGPNGPCGPGVTGKASTHCDDDIQKVLYNLFYDVLNIEFNLWSWVRQMKYKAGIIK